MIFFVFICTCTCLIVCACTICTQVSEEAKRCWHISWGWSHPMWISATEPGSSTRVASPLKHRAIFPVLYISFIHTHFLSVCRTWCSFKLCICTFNFISYFFFLEMPRVSYHTLWASLFYYCWPVCACALSVVCIWGHVYACVEKQEIDAGCPP